MDKEDNKTLAEVWIRAFCGCAAAFNSSKWQATEWADYAVEEYKKRFNV